MKMRAKHNAALVDMDGTMADVSSIRHLVDGLKTKKDFHAFHTASEFVPANKQAIDFCRRHHKAGDKILIVTARMEEWRQPTWRFAERELVIPYGVPVERQYHRADGDYRKDREVKAEILVEIRKEFNVVAACDDNPNIVSLWEDEGIPEIEVVPGWDIDAAAKYAAMANKHK
jgi:phosphoserine phosphatase